MYFQVAIILIYLIYATNIRTIIIKIGVMFIKIAIKI